MSGYDGYPVVTICFTPQHPDCPLRILGGAHRPNILLTSRKSGKKIEHSDRYLQLCEVVSEPGRLVYAELCVLRKWKQPE